MNKNDKCILQNVNSEREAVSLPHFNEDLENQLVKFLRYENYHYHKILKTNVKLCRVAGVKVSRKAGWNGWESSSVEDISEFLLPETCLKLGE